MSETDESLSQSRSSWRRLRRRWIIREGVEGFLAPYRPLSSRPTPSARGAVAIFLTSRLTSGFNQSIPVDQSTEVPLSRPPQHPVPPAPRLLPRAHGWSRRSQNAPKAPPPQSFPPPAACCPAAMLRPRTSRFIGIYPVVVLTSRFDQQTAPPHVSPPPAAHPRAR